MYQAGGTSSSLLRVLLPIISTILASILYSRLPVLLLLGVYYLVLELLLEVAESSRIWRVLAIKQLVGSVSEK